MRAGDGDPRAMFTAGVKRVVTNPRVGMRLAGRLREGPSTQIHDDLTVTALVVADGDTKVVIVACDLIAMSPKEARHLREHVGSRVGVSWINVFLNVSHSHATPSPPSWKEYTYEVTDRERHEADTYYDRLVTAAGDAGEKADAQRVPARVGSSDGSSDVNVNRRERLDDATLVLGHNPAGPVDHQVGVVRIDDLAGDPIAMLANYACHPDVIGPKASVISSDFVGAMRRTAEAVTGATVMFLQGAAGDIYPCTGVVAPPDGPREATRVGTRLGCEAARLFELVETRRRPAHRALVESSQTVMSWHYEDAAATTGPALAVDSTVVELPLRALPTREEAATALEAYQRELREVMTRSSPLSRRLTAHRNLVWAREQLAAVERNAPLSVPVEIQTVTLGGTTLVGLPAEVFTEIGQSIKSLMPHQQVLVCGYTNGVYFYVPTSEAFTDGGYEVESHRNYLWYSGPTSDWGNRLVSMCDRMLTH